MRKTICKSQIINELNKKILVFKNDLNQAVLDKFKEKIKVGESAQKDKNMKYFMESHYAGEGIRFFKGVDEGSDSVKDGFKE